MIEEAILKVSDGKNLTYKEAEEVTREIMMGNTSPAQTAAYLTAMHIKGENNDEIAASAYAMRDAAESVKYDKDIIEIIGTGGDNTHSINISTIAGIVCAAAGAKVAKQGSRASSSKCGAADCLEALGVNIATSPEGCVKLLDEAGICFMFAQKYHKSMKHIAPICKEIGIPTIFNILTPLANPAHANIQLLGVYKPELLMPIAKILVKLGVDRGMVVYGTDKIDEISIGAPTAIVEFDKGRFIKYEIAPEKYGLERCDISLLKGGDPKTNAALVRDILNGAPGAGRQAVLMNAGAALHLYNTDKRVSIKDGIDIAKETIDSGAAAKTLEKYIALSNEVE